MILSSAANGNLARKAKVSLINACAGLSRRRQVTLKKINLGIDEPVYPYGRRDRT
jgi:hypothetical protein